MLNGWRSLTVVPRVDLRAEMRTEPYHRRFLNWFPVLMVLFSFVMLLVVPLWVTNRTNTYRAQVDQSAVPAHALMDSINFDLAVEGSSIRGYLLNNDPVLLDKYRSAREAQRHAMESLQPYVQRIGGGSVPAYNSLRESIAGWHDPQDRLLNKVIDRAGYIAAMPETQRVYEQAFTSSELLAAQIASFEDSHRRMIQRADRFEDTAAIWMAIIGILATFSAGWLAFRLSGQAMQLERRAREEMAFRQIASALTGAVEIDEVLREITQSAALVTRADGVYVEKMMPDGTVEVLAVSGRGTPKRGTKARYPGSLTQEIIDSGQPVVVTDVRTPAEQMPPYLAAVCADCELMIVPLLAEKEALGALVLLNSKTSGRHFGVSDARGAKSLGDLVSLALRRVTMMAREREAREEAQAALATRDEVLGIVSHDLRNPLTSVLLSASLLEEAAEGEVKEQIQIIKVAAQRMQRLIRDLLDVARMEGSRLTLKLQPVDSREVAMRACEEHRPIASQRGQSIVCEVPAGLPPICGDHDRILQLFGNLLGNAVKFTPDGGRILVTARQDGSVIEYSVKDNGPGIPERDLPHVFERYWQAKKTAHLGAGLGLAIARGIAESHGGSVSVANSVDGGAVFSFTIPIAGV